MAEQALKELEDEIVKELSGEMIDNPAETHEEYEARKSDEEKREEREGNDSHDDILNLDCKLSTDVRNYQ